MVKPIYRLGDEAHSDLNINSKPNKGLYFERFFDRYDNNWAVKDNAKVSFLNKFEGVCGDSNLLKAHTEKQTSLAKSLKGDIGVYTLDSHFVTGLGNGHAVENGFLWHHTLGVPYLSGSMVKGLIRAVVEQYYNPKEEDKKELLFKWFGSEHKDPKKSVKARQVGEIIFFDALPIAPPTLSVDVMAPHMGEWYAKGNNINDVNKDADKIPADWHDPKVIPFLAVEKAHFLFSIALRDACKSGEEESETLIKDVFACLNHALLNLGSGAKTQTGYGYMSYNENITKELNDGYSLLIKEMEEQEKESQFEQCLVGKTDLHAELLREIKNNQWEDCNDSIKKNFTDAISSWLGKLENSTHEQDVVLQYIKIAKLHYPKQFKNPKGKGVKPHQREWIEKLLSFQDKK